MIQQTPIGYRDKAFKLVSTKCALLVRIDVYGYDPNGNIGHSFREIIVDKIRKWQELPPARIPKPLSIPDGSRKRIRGGRKVRKYKEFYRNTEVYKTFNRVDFNQPQEVIENDESSTFQYKKYFST